MPTFTHRPLRGRWARGVRPLLVLAAASWLAGWALDLVPGERPVTTVAAHVLRAIAMLCVAGLLVQAGTKAVGPMRSGLTLLGAGAAIWGLTSSARLVDTWSSDSESFAWMSMLFIIAAGLLVAGGLVIGRAHARQIELFRAVVDGVCVGAATILLWITRFDLHDDNLVETVSVAGRTGANALFAAVALLVWVRSDRSIRRVTGLVAAAAAVLLVTDAAYVTQRLSGVDAGLDVALLVFAGWTTVALLLALAAVAAERAWRTDATRSSGPSYAQQATPIVVVLAVLVGIGATDRFLVGQESVGLGLVLVGLLLAGRQVLVVRENAGLQDALRARASELGRLAATDELTGVAHRRVLIARAEQALAAIASGDGHVALVFVDLDGFKQINDRLGHSTGDEVLKVVAARLQQRAAAEDLVARFGGDEFVILRGSACDAAAGEWLQTIRDELSQPIEVNGVRLRVTASVGLVIADSTYTDVDRMLGDADLAMYEAKRAGTNRAEHFTLSMRSNATDRLREAATVQRAIEDGRLLVHYQPIVDLATDQVVGAEALVRLRGEDGSLIPPDEFLPIARTLGLMPEISEHVVSTACTDFAHGPPAEAGWWVSVNLGTDELTDPRVVDRVTSAMTSSRLPATRLVVEVSEQALPVPAIRRTIETLQATGVSIALDDFGSGSSSFAQLRNLPLQMVKLDPRLANVGAGGESSRSALLTSVVALAHELDLVVVAEGVEHWARAWLLQRAGCHLGQGFLWGPAVSWSDLVRFERLPQVRPDGARHAAPTPTPTGQRQLLEASRGRPGSDGAETPVGEPAHPGQPSRSDQPGKPPAPRPTLTGPVGRPGDRVGSVSPGSRRRR